MSDSEDRSWRTDGESERGVAKEEEEKVETRIGEKKKALMRYVVGSSRDTVRMPLCKMLA